MAAIARSQPREAVSTRRAIRIRLAKKLRRARPAACPSRVGEGPRFEYGGFGMHALHLRKVVAVAALSLAAPAASRAGGDAAAGEHKSLACAACHVSRD